MHPCYNDYWLVGALPTEDHDYEDAEYDVYLFWPSSSPQVLVPATVEHEDHPPEFLSHADLYSYTDDDDELDTLDLGSSWLLNLSPTFSFDSDFVFPDSHDGAPDGFDENGYSRLFRMGFVSKSHRFTRKVDDLFKSAWHTLASSLRRLRLSRL